MRIKYGSILFDIFFLLLQINIGRLLLLQTSQEILGPVLQHEKLFKPDSDPTESGSVTLLVWRAKIS